MPHVYNLLAMWEKQDCPVVQVYVAISRWAGWDWGGGSIPHPTCGRQGGFGAGRPVCWARPHHPQSSGAPSSAPTPQEPHSEDGGPQPALLPVAQPESCLRGGRGQCHCPGATPSRPCPARGARSQARAALPAGAGLCQAAPQAPSAPLPGRGRTRAGQGHPSPAGVAGERGAGEDKVPQPLAPHGGHGKVIGEERACCLLDAAFACPTSAGRHVWGRSCIASW